MEKEILVDENIYPDNEVIKKALGKDQFNFYSKFIEKVENLNLITQWRYYKDSKSWLGKVLSKKKNLGWLSIWNTGFKVTVFFTERTVSGLYDLPIDNGIKIAIKEVNPVGKLLPIVVAIDSDEILNDIIQILEYKIKYIT